MFVFVARCGWVGGCGAWVRLLCLCRVPEDRPFNRGLTDKPFVLTHRSPTINDYSKQLKAAIEQIQRLLAKGRTKLQEDFDEWCVCARATVYAVYVCVYVIIREGPDKAAG